MLLPEQLEELYIQQVEDYCNVTFDRDHLPAGVRLAVNDLIKNDPSGYNIASEKLSDMSITYNNTGGDMPKYVMKWLEPYRRPFLVSNKAKRPYINGR